MASSSLVRPLLALSLAAGLSACADLTIKQDLDPQLSEVQAIRADLEAAWNGVGKLVTDTESQLQAFTSQPIAPEVSESPEAVDAIVEAMDAKLAEGELPSSAEASAPLDEKLGTVSDETRAWADGYVSSGLALLSQLKNGLPTLIQSGAKQAASAAVEIARIRTVSQNKRAVARDNPLMTDEDRAELEAEYAALESEADQLDALAERIGREAQDYGARVRTALDALNGKLDALKELK